MSTDIVQAGGALAIRPDQTDWTPQQQAVLQQSGIDNQVTSAELSAFLHLCQRTRLDPFSRQIYLIGRWDSRQQRKVYTPQTSIDGYRVIAHRVVAEQSADLGYEDNLWCDKDGQWRDVWLSETPPAGVKVTVIRNGQRFPAVALFREYVQTGKENKPIGLWGKMPAGQLAKCAEALALRKAFPHDLAGVYTAEEMAQADNPAEERHLQAVQAGEADPWATAAPQPQTVAVHGRSQPAQDLAGAATDAVDQATVKEIYRQARTDGLLAETVKTADRELLELGAYLIRRGQELAAPESPSEQQDDGVVDVETVDEPEDDHAAAVTELRTAAEAANLRDFEQGAYSALGCSVEDASANAIRNLAAQIRGAA